MSTNRLSAGSTGSPPPRLQVEFAQYLQVENLRFCMLPAFKVQVMLWLWLALLCHVSVCLVLSLTQTGSRVKAYPSVVVLTREADSSLSAIQLPAT